MAFSLVERVANATFRANPVLVGSIEIYTNALLYALILEKLSTEGVYSKNTTNINNKNKQATSTKYVAKPAHRKSDLRAWADQAPKVTRVRMEINKPFTTFVTIW